MIKKFDYRYFPVIFIIIAVFLLLIELYVPGLVLIILWYFLFGPVGLTFFFNIINSVRATKVSLALTLPIFLLPYRKSYYYWLKAIYLIESNSKKSNFAINYTNKVNPKKLCTDNDRSMFYFFLACMHTDLDNKEESILYFKKANETPHKKIVDEQIKDFEALVKKKTIDKQ